MTAEQAQREPTMEEILASIRRIISEEDQPPGEGGDVLELAPQPPVIETAAPAPEPAPQPPPAPVAAAEPPPAAVAPPPAPAAVEPAPAHDTELIVQDFEEPAPPVVPVPQPIAAAAPEPRPVFRAPVEDGLVAEGPAVAAASSLGKLMGSMHFTSGATLDDVVRALLKPMLKEWLDANLPALVEAEVAKEIERIRRLAR